MKNKKKDYKKLKILYPNKPRYMRWREWCWRLENPPITAKDILNIDEAEIGCP